MECPRGPVRAAWRVRLDAGRGRAQSGQLGRAVVSGKTRRKGLPGRRPESGAGERGKRRARCFGLRCCVDRFVGASDS